MIYICALVGWNTSKNYKYAWHMHYNESNTDRIAKIYGTLNLMFSIPKCYNTYKKKHIQGVSHNTTVYLPYHKIVYCQGDMFRPLLVIFRPTINTNSRTICVFMHFGIPNAILQCIKTQIVLGFVFLVGLKMTNKGRNMSPWQYTVFMVR